jgi:hypothetical protein
MRRDAESRETGCEDLEANGVDSGPHPMAGLGISGVVFRMS